MKTKYYMIEQYHIERQNPVCACGVGSYVISYPYENIKPLFCYTSLKRVENYCYKLNCGRGYKYGWRYRVIDVTSDILQQALNAALMEG